MKEKCKKQAKKKTTTTTATTKKTNKYRKEQGRTGAIVKKWELNDFVVHLS